MTSISIQYNYFADLLSVIILANSQLRLCFLRSSAISTCFIIYYYLSFLLNVLLVVIFVFNFSLCIMNILMVNCYMLRMIDAFLFFVHLQVQDHLFSSIFSYFSWYDFLSSLFIIFYIVRLYLCDVVIF